MSNELVISSLGDLGSSLVPIDLAQYGSESQFFPRLQLVTKGRYVDLQKIQPGHYGVPQGEDEIEDLGDTVDILPLVVRDKALDTNGETPIAVFDKNDPLFQDIVTRAGEKDSGCMFGPSVLVFERNTGRFLEFFMGNKSARMEAPNLAPYLPVGPEQAKLHGIEPRGPVPCTLRAKFIKRPRYSWHAPVISKCSTPFTNVPALEVVMENVKRFVNEKNDTPEVVNESGRQR